MKIRMLRNVLVDGEHRAAGEVVDVDERLAIQLIQWQRAEAVDAVKIETAAPETTTAEPNAETAVKPPAKKRIKGDK